MKKLKTIIVVVILTFILTGCNGNVTRDIRHAGFSLVSNEFICSDLMPKNDKDTSYKKISYMNDKFAITEEGTIYEVSLNQPYSNKENCKMSSFTSKVVATLDDNIIKAEDGKLYYTPANTSSTPYTEVTVNDNSYEIYKLLFEDSTVKKVITADQSAGSYYVLSSDGNIYNYIINRENYNSPYILQDKKVAYYKVDYNGEIIDFSYNSNSKSLVYLKTNNEIYRTLATNANECKKYADVTCKYKLQKDETLTKYYKDKILYYGPTTLITTYGKMFS